MIHTCPICGAEYPLDYNPRSSNDLYTHLIHIHEFNPIRLLPGDYPTSTRPVHINDLMATMRAPDFAEKVREAVALKLLGGQ